MNGIEEWPDDHPGAVGLSVLGALFFCTMAVWLWKEFLNWLLA